MIAGDQVSVCNVFPDQAYMAGIFHECGVPVLMMRFPDYCSKLHLDDVSCWPNLAEEDAVGTDILFGAMGSNRFGDEVRRDRAVDEDFLWFLFCHYRIKSTDPSHADAYADEGLDHGIFKFNFIQREMMVQATI